MDTQSPAQVEPVAAVLDRAAFDQKAFAQTACAFLQRADLKGSDVPLYGEVWNTLQAIGTGELKCADPQHQQDLHGRDNELEVLRQRTENLQWELDHCKAALKALVPVENLGSTPVEPDQHHAVIEAADAAAALDGVSMEPPAVPA